VDLVAEGFDLAIRAGHLEDSTLVARRVGVPVLVLCASPAYLRRRGRPKAFSDLASHDAVLFRPHGGRATWTLTGPAGDESVEVTGRVSVDEISFAMRACAAGLGIALLPTSLAREPALRGEIESVLSDYSATIGEVSVVLPSSAFVPARVALLRDHLVEHLQREIAESLRQCTNHRPRKR
jgi:DNA-binding transcriptional LysR family regulator